MVPVRAGLVYVSAMWCARNRRNRGAARGSLSEGLVRGEGHWGCGLSAEGVVREPRVPGGGEAGSRAGPRYVI